MNPRNFLAAAASASTLMIAACTSTARSRDAVTPYADYLAHLPSPNVSAHRMKPPLPAVELPAELEDLLRRRERVAVAPAPLLHRQDPAGLYTDDAVILHGSFRNWLRGPSEGFIQSAVYAAMTLDERPYHMTPVAYQAGSSVGYIAGFFTQEDSGGTHHVGAFHLALARNRAGAWAIAAESESFPGPATPTVLPVEDLIRNLDAAGVRKAVVTSLAFWWGSSLLAPVPDERTKVREENEWLAAQVARYPDRLVGYCSFNVLKDYALDEIEWCSRNRYIKGIKLHFGDAGVDLHNPRHIAQLRRVFQSANAHRLPIVSHFATQENDYGRTQARIYLDSILPAAPDIPIQMAHLAGHGPSHGGEALAVFADAAEARDPRMKNVYVDVSSNVWDWTPRAELELIARRIRQFGPEHVLFGTDWPAAGPEFTQKSAWAFFRRLPLGEAEFATIAGNVTPWIR